eukprot:scaffold1112_cov92-Amphora_coffeaeformis.AAC.30
MCSPSKKRVSSCDQDRDDLTPQPNKKRRRGDLPTTKTPSQKRRPDEFSCEEANFLVTYFEDRAAANECIPEKIKFVCTPGKPRLKISNLCHGEEAPFKLVYINGIGNRFIYVPTGEPADVFFFIQIVKAIHANGISENPLVVSTICFHLSQLIRTADEICGRVTTVLNRAEDLIAKSSAELHQYFESIGCDKVVLKEILDRVLAFKDQPDLAAAVVLANSKASTAVAQSNVAITVASSAKSQADKAVVTTQSFEERLSAVEGFAKQCSNLPAQFAGLQRGVNDRFGSFAGQWDNYRQDMTNHFDTYRQSANDRFESLTGQFNTHRQSVDHRVDTLGKGWDERFQTVQSSVASFGTSLSAMPNPVYFYSKCCTANGEVRKPNPDPKAVQEIVAITFFLDSLPSHPGVCYRGIDLLDMPPQWLENTLRSREFCDAGCTSTSLSQSVAWHFASLGACETYTPRRLILVIQQKTGRYVKEYVADEFKWEEEIILKPKTRLRIIGYGKGDAPNLPAHEVMGLEEI